MRAARPRWACRPPSWTFFDKPASEDDLAQSALLAGLPQAPSEYNPFEHPLAATRAAQRGAGEDGAARLHQRRRRRARARAPPLGLRANNHYGDLRDNYLLDFVEQELIDATARRA